jgi:hypothetical protein
VTTDPGLADSESDENPYAAPGAEIRPYAAEELVDGGPVSIRRAFHRRERSIKRLAWVNLLVAILWLPAAAGSLFFLMLSTLRGAGVDIVPSLRLPPTLPTGGPLVAITAFHLGVFSLSIALLIGLRALRSWARWTMVGLASFLLVAGCLTAFLSRRSFALLLFDVAFAGCGLLLAAIIYVLVAPPSGKVFTREYRDAVAQTRGMR